MNPLQCAPPKPRIYWDRLALSPEQKNDVVRQVVTEHKEALVEFTRGRGFRDPVGTAFNGCHVLRLLTPPEQNFIARLHDDGDQMEMLLSAAQSRGIGGFRALIDLLICMGLRDWSDKMQDRVLELVAAGGAEAPRGEATEPSRPEAEPTRSEAEVARLQAELEESRQQLYRARQLLEERARVIARQQDDIAHLQTQILLAGTQGLAR